MCDVAIFGSRWLCAWLFTAMKRNEGYEGSVINRHTQLLLIMEVVWAQILNLMLITQSLKKNARFMENVWLWVKY